MNLKEAALSGAQRICCFGTCISGYECGRAKDRYQLPLALCAECDNTGEVKVHKDGSMSVKRKDLTVCTDCVVKMIEESIAESAAEAQMS